MDLHFARLVPDQAELRVSQSLFKKGATGEITASISSDLSPIQSLLAAGPLVLTDPSIIETGAFTEAHVAELSALARRAQEAGARAVLLPREVLRARAKDS